MHFTDDNRRDFCVRCEEKSEASCRGCHKHFGRTNKGVYDYSTGGLPHTNFPAKRRALEGTTNELPTQGGR